MPIPNFDGYDPETKDYFYRKGTRRGKAIVNNDELAMGEDGGPLQALTTVEHLLEQGQISQADIDAMESLKKIAHHQNEHVANFQAPWKERSTTV